MTASPFSLPLSRRGALALGGGLGASAVLGGGRSQAAAAPRRLVVAMPVGLRTLEPVREVSNVMFRTAYNIFDTLIAADYRDNARLVPSLATSWRRTEPRVLELELREGVRFHDGSLFSAEDVAFSFGPQRLAAPAAPGYALSRPFLSSIEHVEVVSPRLVRVVTRTPDPLLEQRLAGWCGQIVCKKAFLAAANFEAWERAPVGTGPFAVAELRTDERLVLKAHEAYFAGRPTIDELVFHTVPEMASRMNALANGEVDIITEVAPDQFKPIAAMPGARVSGGPIQNIRVIVYDKNHPVLADVRIRRALGLAIDRKVIVDSLYAGRAMVPPGLQDPAFGALYMPDYPAPGFQPDRARALLKEAGYAGAVIPYRLLPSYYTLQMQTAQILVEMWAQVGLKVELQVKENTAQLIEPKEGRGIRDWSNTIFWNDPAGVLSRLYGPEGPTQVVNKEWTNAAFNDASQVLVGSLDTAERKRAFRRMLEIWDNEDPAGTVLHDLTMFYGQRSNVPWQPYPVEYMDFRAANMVA